MSPDEPINVGYDQTTGQAVTVDQGTYAHWRAKGLAGDHSLLCLYCHQSGHDVPLVVCYRIGGRRRMYFRHPPGTARGGHSPETVWHVDGKLLIAGWAARQPGVSGVEPERWTGDRIRRADILITFNEGARIAMELQTRPLTDADWSARHRDYMQQGIVDVWLWHPHLDRPGILLEQQVDLWFLDVAERAIGVPLGQPHQRTVDWRAAPDASVFATHYPPCLTDRIVRRWRPLPQFPLYPSGLGLPAALKAELAAAQDRLLRSPHHPPPRRIDCDVATSSAVLFTAANPGPGNPRQPTTEPYVPPPDGYLRHLYEYLRSDIGVAGKITIRGRSRSTANGYRVYADGRLIGVAYPRPDHPAQWKDLNGLLVYVAANQARWISRTAPLGTKLRIIRRISPMAEPRPAAGFGETIDQASTRCRR